MAADDPDVLAVLAAVTVGHDAPAPRGAAPAWLEQVRQRLEQEAGVRVGQIARDAGVHPVYLARCFRRWFGCSVAAGIQRARLRRAAALMPDTGRTLGRIAYDAGFADQAHLNHRFRAVTGLTPGGFRGFLDQSAPAIGWRDRRV